MDVVTYSNMIGKTAVSVVGEIGDDELIFSFSDGSKYRFYHDQDCCECVTIDDIVGDLADLVGNPLLICEAVSEVPTEPKPNEWLDSFTWTFYKFGTIKGSVTVKWYGESNGYYSEKVDFEKVS